MKKRVLHIPNYYPPHIGGIEQVCYDNVQALKDLEQVVICFNSEKETKVDIVDGIKVIRCGCFAKVASQSLSLCYRRELKKIIKEFNPDVIHFHYPNPLVSTALFSIKFKSELIVHYHLDIIKQKVLKYLFTFQTKKMLKRANKIIATSPNYVKNSKNLTKFEDKVVVIPNMVNLERLKETEESINILNELKEKYKDKTVVFAVGRHVPYKGIEYLVRASKLLDDSFKILIGGKGPLTDSLKELAKDDDKVTFLGRISDAEMIAYFNLCDIFAFPSITKNEAFGIALAEGMYYGKPAVTFTIEGSGVNYVNLDKVTGLEVENKNYEKYAEAIKLLQSNKQMANEFGINAKKRVLENFTALQVNKLVIDLYDEIFKNQN